LKYEFLGKIYARLFNPNEMVVVAQLQQGGVPAGVDIIRYLKFINRGSSRDPAVFLF
jgi:hypothetical protein